MEFHGTAHIFDGRFGGHVPKVISGQRYRDHISGDIVDHLAAPAHAEIDINIGHRDAFRIKKTLEEQFVLQRIDVGDTQRIGDQRSGC